MRELTVKQYAAREQVDERTVRRWIEKGAIDARKTPGGRFRITPTLIRTVADTRGQSDR